MFNTIILKKGVELYYAEEYALDYCECDEEGEIMFGSDFDLAEEEEEEEKMEIRRELDEIPFDKRFELVGGGEGLCHSTGYEVCDGDPNTPGNWWNEYEDSDGNLYYGR